MLGNPDLCQLVDIIVEGYDGLMVPPCHSHPPDKWRLISPRTYICDQVCPVVVWCQVCPIVHTEEQLVAPLPLLVTGKLCPFPSSYLNGAVTSAQLSPAL